MFFKLVVLDKDTPILFTTLNQEYKKVCIAELSEFVRVWVLADNGYPFEGERFMHDMQPRLAQM